MGLNERGLSSRASLATRDLTKFRVAIWSVMYVPVTGWISPKGRNDMVVDRRYYVYILTNWNHTVLYVGVTSDLTRRMFEHKNKLVKGFTEKYNVYKLVYFQETDDILSAITREKEIKKWRRDKKSNLVSNMNPGWKDLSDSW